MPTSVCFPKQIDAPARAYGRLTTQTVQSVSTESVCAFAAETARKDHRDQMQDRIRQAKLPLLKQSLQSSWQAGDKLFGLERAVRAKEAAQACAQTAERDLQQLKQATDEYKKRAAQEMHETKQQADADIATATSLKLQAEQELGNVRAEVHDLQSKLKNQDQVAGSMAADAIKWQREAMLCAEQYQGATDQSMHLRTALA